MFFNKEKGEKMIINNFSRTFQRVEVTGWAATAKSREKVNIETHIWDVLTNRRTGWSHKLTGGVNDEK